MTPLKFAFAAAALAAFALPLTSRGTAPDTGICRGKQLLYVMNFHEVEDAKAEVPPNLALIKHKEDVRADDYKTIEHFKALGFAVTNCDESGSVDLTKEKDLIVVSESVNANEIGAKYTHLTIPVVCWENDLYDDLRMTGKRLNVDYGSNRTTKATALRLFNAPHPLSAGLAAGIQDVYLAPREMNWGRPGLGAAIIAMLPNDPDVVPMFAYEKGATMDYDFPAPARRVGLFLWENVFGSLSPQGLALFDAAIVWAVTQPPPLAAVDPTIARGKQVLYVMNLHEVGLLKAEVPADPSRIKRQEEILANDLKTVEHLKSLGFTVTTTDEHPTTDVTKGVDLVVISDSVNARQVQGKYKLLPIPVVMWAGDLYGDMGLTGRKPGQDFGTTGSPGGKDGDRFATMVNEPHPLSAGLKADIIQNLYDDNEYMTNWGKPSPGAINIATIPGYPDRRIVFAYEKGATMAGDTTAPARRVAFFLCMHDLDHLLPEGRALLDAAFLWAVSKP